MGELKYKEIKWPKLATDYKPEPGSIARDPKLYKHLRRYAREEWAKTARTFEANPGSFFNAWWYLTQHPIYWRILKDAETPHMRNLENDQGFDGIWVHVTRVNPKTRKIEKDKALNTRTEVWLETGEFAWVPVPEHHIGVGQHYHNYRVDAGAETYEAAVIKLARNVHRFYGNDRRKCDPENTQRKRDKQKKKRPDGPRVIYGNPYAHPCAHRWGEGLHGRLARSMAQAESAPRD